MKITAKKSVIHREIVTIQECFEVRLQINPKLIVTLIVETEDGEMEYYGGKTKKDKDIINGLSTVESNYLGLFLEQQKWA